MKGLVIAAAVVSGLFVAARVGAVGGASKTVDLMQVGEFTDGTASTAKGTAELLPDGDKVKVVFTLSGLEPNSVRAAHIHRGSCADPGGLRVPLQSVKADADGKATTSTIVDAAKLKGSLYFAVHQRDMNHPDGVGDVVACGDIQ